MEYAEYLIAKYGGIIPFDNHHDAEDFVKKNAVGRVCVVDRWTYGRIEFLKDRCSLKPAGGRGFLDCWQTINPEVSK
jgi:hypothetical protein